MEEYGFTIIWTTKNYDGEAEIHYSYFITLEGLQKFIYELGYYSLRDFILESKEALVFNGNLKPIEFDFKEELIIKE